MFNFTLVLLDWLENQLKFVSKIIGADYWNSHESSFTKEYSEDEGC